MARESISVFDIFKIGIGPSSSHTMGPWRAAQKFVESLGDLSQVVSVSVDLYGSLAKTGKGHGTDVAVLLGLSGFDPETMDPNWVTPEIEKIDQTKSLKLGGTHTVPMSKYNQVRFHMDESLPFHPNGVTFHALKNNVSISATYYSVGGGFIVQDDEQVSGPRAVALPHPIDTAEQLEDHCDCGLSIPEVVMENELRWRSPAEIEQGLDRLWDAMKSCAHRGCSTQGILPGGLFVKRRAKELCEKLLGESAALEPNDWIEQIRTHRPDFQSTLKWVSCFALAVNEENAAFGRVVTAPTNGAAGVIPSVLLYDVCFNQATVDRTRIHKFILTAGELGSLFKKGATISAAMGGCQAEIGVSSAMAAGALCQVMGGSVGQCLMAAEIAMEHHLGMTCDPIGGLVQVPCIERNTMGAAKAITAAMIALESDPTTAKVSLDDVILTMWTTAKDMNDKYKETSEGGLALNVPVSVPEC